MSYWVSIGIGDQSFCSIEGISLSAFCKSRTERQKEDHLLLFSRKKNMHRFLSHPRLFCFWGKFCILYWTWQLEFHFEDFFSINPYQVLICLSPLWTHSLSTSLLVPTLLSIHFQSRSQFSLGIYFCHLRLLQMAHNHSHTNNHATQHALTLTQ